MNLDQLAELENTANPTNKPPSLNGAFNTAPLHLNFKGVVSTPPLWPVGKYPFEVTEVEQKTSKNGEAYAHIELMCLAGPYKDKKFSNGHVLMLEGKGFPSTKNFMEAGSLLDNDEQFRGTLADFVGVKVWGKVVQKKETYKEEEQIRNRIAFNGFEPLDKYPIPAADDPFADENAPGKYPATVSGFGTQTTGTVTSGNASVVTSKPAWE